VQRTGVGISVSKVLFPSRHRKNFFFLILRDKIFHPFRTSSEYEEILRTFGELCDVPDTVKEELFADQTCLQNSQAAVHNEQLQDNLVVNESFYLLCLNKMSTVNFL
jgi:hypothetical protein